MAIDEVLALLGTVIVLIYSFAGGIRASIWTDAAQSLVMVFAMPLLMWMTMQHVGGWSSMTQQLSRIEDGYMNWFPPGSTFLSALLFVVGWLSAGFGVVGQPHIMVRTMSLTDAKLMNRVRSWYYGWFLFFYGATVVVGLLSRLIITDAANFASELALPTMAVRLMPEVLAGMVLAGLFAATMSTADSLVISCSAAVSRDIRPKRQLGFMFTKIATATVVGIALLIALFGNDSVFELVILAWGLLASAFAPIMLIYRFGRLPSEAQCIGLMLAGVISYLICHYTVVSEYTYALLPSMLVSFATFGLISLVGSVERVGTQKQS